MWSFIVIIYNAVFYVPLLNGLFFLTNILPRGDLGTAVIILTIFIRLLISPLNHKMIKTQQVMKKIEPEIADKLLSLKSDLLLIGQAKGKFGGGKRRAWRQTQKKTMEGNVVTFSSMAVVGDESGHIGVGMGKAKETLPAREKALRQAKLNIIKVIRGFETQEENKDDPHTVPFIVTGKCGSIRIKLMPAARGTGLVIGDECKKILKLAGIKDVYSVTKGNTRTTFNVAKACIDALSKTGKMKL